MKIYRRMLLVAALLVLAGCQPDPTATQPVAMAPDNTPAATEPVVAVDDTQATASTEITPAADDPAAVVDAFYVWYHNLFGDLSSGLEHNPLVEGTYRDATLLTPELIAEVDALGEGGFFFDPFLCAQDIPTAVTAEVAFANGNSPLVLATSNFANHAIVVALTETDSGWQINRITCVSTPVGTATAFYTWYLGNIGSPADGTFRNLLVDGGYREGPYLSADLVSRIDAELSGGAIGGDPFLLAQNIPVAFTVEEGPEPDTAVVRLQFNVDATPTHDLLVRLQPAGGGYEITEIGLADS